MSNSIVSTNSQFSVLPSQHQNLNTLNLPPYGSYTNGTTSSMWSGGIDLSGGYAMGGIHLAYPAGGSWNGFGLASGGRSFVGGGDSYSTGSVSVIGGDGRVYGGCGLNAANTGVSGNAVLTAGAKVTNGIVGYTISNPGAGYPLDGTFMDVSVDDYYYLHCSTSGIDAAAVEITISSGQLTGLRIGGVGGGFGSGSSIGDVFTLYIADPDYPNTAPTTLAQITVTDVGDNTGGNVLIRDCHQHVAIKVNDSGDVLLQPLGTNSLTLSANGEWNVAGAGTGTSGQVLTSQGSGTAPTWTSLPPPVGPAGGGQEIQFNNNAGGFGASSALRFDPAVSTLYIDSSTGYGQLEFTGPGPYTILTGGSGDLSMIINGGFLFQSYGFSLNSSDGNVGDVFTSGGTGGSPVWTTPNYNNPQTTTLVAGTVSVSDTTVTGSTTVLVTVQTPGGTQGFLSVAVTAGVGFVINSTDVTETSTVAYFRVG